MENNRAGIDFAIHVCPVLHTLPQRPLCSSHSRFEQVPSNPSNMMVGAALLALAIRLLPLQL